MNLGENQNRVSLFAPGVTAEPLGKNTVGYLDSIIIFPADTEPGDVVISDGTVTLTFLIGTLSELKPLQYFINARSHQAPWTITTPADASCAVIGQF